jgi:osomolarity two-component system sensor histidine kinase NIK1
MADESTLTAASSILQYLAIDASRAPVRSNQCVKLPGPNTPAKLALESEIGALVERIQHLEAKASTVNNHSLPDTPNETGAPSAFADVLTGSQRRSSLKSSSARHQYSNSRESLSGERPQKLPKLSNDELIETLQQEIVDQAEQIRKGKLQQNAIKAQMEEQAEHQKHLINQFEAKRVASLERELKKHQQANEAFQKALREIGEIITAVARGDLSKKVQIHSVEMDPEITTFKRVCLTCSSRGPCVFSDLISRLSIP